MKGGFLPLTFLTPAPRAAQCGSSIIVATDGQTLLDQRSVTCEMVEGRYAYVSIEGINYHSSETAVGSKVMRRHSTHTADIRLRDIRQYLWPIV